MKLPRLVIAGLSGDSGKTTVSLSLLAALRQRRVSLSVFKKGPDYIDSAWLSSVAQTTCRNLDTYLVSTDRTFQSFTLNASKSGISVIEGNRGLFDGKDPSGTHSTAVLAKLLQAPVVIVVNTSKATRTIAALVNGCISFDPEIRIAGIILNKLAGRRHESVITDAIERYCGIPVLGTVPQLGDESVLVPNRHLGLVTPQEFEKRSEFEAGLTKVANDYLDVEGLMDVASSACPLDVPEREIPEVSSIRAKIGYFKDSVFTFYYPENLESLVENGADIIPISSLDDTQLPDIDALYIGGGFPETHADLLARNRLMMESVRRSAAGGLPIYAECGGLVYLASSVTWNDNRYPMAGVFPIELLMHSKPVGHGYTQVQIDRPNPFFEVGTVIRGHEFHYSGPADDPSQLESCMSVKKGVGLGFERDGLLYKNTLACYTHIHSDGVGDWASSVLSSARRYRAGCIDRNTGCINGNNRCNNNELEFVQKQ
jgi:cobyrinic acid a,c-diamide synthase